MITTQTLGKAGTGVQHICTVSQLVWVIRSRQTCLYVWNMKGIYLEVSDCAGTFRWFTEEEINSQAALPTAFRLFWEEKDYV